METYYLVDYENVREYGLEGISGLSDHDHIYLFYTTNANKISLDIIANNKAEFRAVKVAAGHQSLDMHLISFLGYIIGSVGEVQNYVIISDDKGFDSTMSFWNASGLAHVERRKRIRTAASPEAVNEAPKETPKEPQKEQQKEQQQKNVQKKQQRNRRNGRNRNNENGKPAEETAEAVPAPSEEPMVREESVVILEEPEPAGESDLLPQETEEISVPAETEPEAPEAEESAAQAEVSFEEEAFEEPAQEPDTQEVPSEPQKQRQRNRNSRKRSRGRSKENGNAQEAASETISASEPEQETAEAAELSFPEETSPAPETDAPPADQETDPLPFDLSPKALKIVRILVENNVEYKHARTCGEIVDRHASGKNRKYDIYREILRKFRQKRGMQYYNYIKKDI